MGESVDENLDLDALRRGNPRAFARLVELHQPVVLGLCQSMGLRGADSDDAAAEVFAAVFRSIARFEGRSALATWIYRIACRVIPKVRRRYRAASSQQPDETQADENQETPLERTSRNEINARVWTAVESLDDRSAIVVEMFYRRGLSVEQIGQVIDCPSGTVKTLLFRARVRLKEVLSRQEIVS
ncbi:MAG TPA: sigma-70 family RNA polymerase sigma factor [Tepidisphaeraceae bacterium]|nr:sigma-70 family RNA polymerase sigma factor [Tepidisphaeraceae bacterium]